MSSQQYTGQNIVFIVGCQRSGTTYLQRLLASHPKIKTGQESFLFSWYLAPLLGNWENKEPKSLQAGRGGVGMRSYFTDEDFRSVLHDFMLAMMKPMIGNLQDGELFLEKTPDHALCIPAMIELLPSARFIHILRDARDNVASLLAAGRTWGKTWAPHHTFSAAKRWVRYEQAVREGKKLVPPAQFYEVRYEELLESPVQTLKSIARFLGIEWIEANLADAVERNKPESVQEKGTQIVRGGEFAMVSGDVVQEPKGFVRKAQPGSWKHDLNLFEKFQVWVLARKMMREEGYPWRFPW